MTDNPMGRHITPGHVRAFQAITSRLYDNITLWSCTIDGAPGVAIVMVDEPAPGKLAVMPLFVAVTERMALDFEGEATTGGSGSSSRRPRNGFDAAQQEATAPMPS